jgi:hypothetical protein
MVASDRTSPDALKVRLTQAGVAARRIEPVEPSLEDVFLEVVAGVAS